MGMKSLSHSDRKMGPPFAALTAIDDFDPWSTLCFYHSFSSLFRFLSPSFHHFLPLSSLFLLLLFSLFLPPPCPTVYKYVKEVETENLSRLLWKSFVVSSSCHSCIQYSLSTVPRPGHTSVRWADMAPPSPPARRSAAPGLAGSNQEQCWWTGQVLSQLGEQICCWLLLSSFSIHSETHGGGFSHGLSGLRLGATKPYRPRIKNKTKQAFSEPGLWSKGIM